MRQPDAAVRRFSSVLFDPWCLVPYYTSALANGLAAAGVSTVVVSPTYDLDPDCFRRMGVRNDPGPLDIFRMGRLDSPILRRAGKMAQGAANMAAQAARYTQSAPDIVHVQQLGLLQRGIPAEMWFLRFARAMGSKLVYTVHNMLPHDTDGRHRAVFGRLYRSMDMLICHSGAVATAMMNEFSLPASRICVIPHGTLFATVPRPSAPEARACLGLDSGASAVLCQGFIRPYKGIEFLLDAWSELHRQCAAARLLIAGSGEPAYLDSLRTRAVALGIAHVVDFRLGFADVSEVAALYAAADAVVYPYREITSSGALMTGIAAGQAIVATDLPPFREVLRHGENALLVPWGDTSALATAILSICRDDRLARDLRRNTEVTASAFSWIELARLTRACYETVLGTNARPAPPTSAADLGGPL